MKLVSILFVGGMAVSLLTFAKLSSGMELDPDKALHDWQVKRLMQPSQRELEKERDGNVYIYDGLSEQDVDVAMTTHFYRIENMMFIGTVKTDRNGKPMLDATSGQPILESGSCDDK